MVVHTCELCHYTTKHSWVFQDHLKCKKHLELQDNTTGVFYHECKNCCKKYKSSSGLRRHNLKCKKEETTVPVNLATNAELINHINEIKNELKNELRDVISNLQPSINNTTNNNNTNHNSNIIIINNTNNDTSNSNISSNNNTNNNKTTSNNNNNNNNNNNKNKSNKGGRKSATTRTTATMEQRSMGTRMREFGRTAAPSLS